jgi:predicted DNA-binding transcriptional regulator AlpA|tara:strand:+ start:238 stop:426 length:189 start_codon:yes stop_codon:yes gene_type:complete
MNMTLVTRKEIANELRVCSATFDNWRKDYETIHGKKFPGEIRIGPRKILFNRQLVLEYLNVA